MTEPKRFATVVFQYVPELSPEPGPAPGFSFQRFAKVKIENCRVFRVMTVDDESQQSGIISMVSDDDASKAVDLKIPVDLVEQFPIGKRVTITIE